MKTYFENKQQNPIIQETKIIVTTTKELRKIEENIDLIEEYFPLGTVLNSVDAATTAFALDSIKKSINAIRVGLKG